MPEVISKRAIYGSGAQPRSTRAAPFTDPPYIDILACGGP
jgi:hypothetical protein